MGDATQIKFVLTPFFSKIPSDFHKYKNIFKWQFEVFTEAINFDFGTGQILF